MTAFHGKEELFVQNHLQKEDETRENAFQKPRGLVSHWKPKEGWELILHSPEKAQTMLLP